MPVVLKGLTVAAVVATTGGAAVEIQHVTKPKARAPKTQAARHPAASSSPTAPALKAKLTPAATTTERRSRAAKARAGRGTPRSRSGRGMFVAPRGEQVATPPAPLAATPPPAAPAPAPAPAPAAAQQQHQPQQAPAASAPAKKDPSKTAIGQLEDIRQQVVDALEQAQSIAAGGTVGAIDTANEMLQGTLGTLRPAIERILARVGLKLPQAAAAPAPPTTTTPSTPPPSVMAPVQQMLDGVDTMLSKLFGRRVG
jgi:hypothetical protein